jgi:uncharacterized delta-60 repeat protein
LDGKILIGGAFTNYNGTPRNGIARLNADGSLDNGFNPASGADGSAFILAQQLDGKILFGGDFTLPRKSIARLNADGSLDTGFNPGTGADHQVNIITLQPDGKILIGGLSQATTAHYAAASHGSTLTARWTRASTRALEQTTRSGM